MLGWPGTLKLLSGRTGESPTGQSSLAHRDPVRAWSLALRTLRGHAGGVPVRVLPLRRILGAQLPWACADRRDVLPGRVLDQTAADGVGRAVLGVRGAARGLAHRHELRPGDDLCIPRHFAAGNLLPDPDCATTLVRLPVAGNVSVHRGVLDRSWVRDRK